MACVDQVSGDDAAEDPAQYGDREQIHAPGAGGQCCQGGRAPQGGGGGVLVAGDWVPRGSWWGWSRPWGGARSCRTLRLPSTRAGRGWPCNGRWWKSLVG